MTLSMLIICQEVCLQAYTSDNACRKKYSRQKDALGLTSGIRSNHTAEQEAQAQQQCGDWLKQRRSSCESFLQQAANICYQLNSEAENQQQRQAQELADNLLGSWKGDFSLYGGSENFISYNYQVTLHINRKSSANKFSGIMQFIVVILIVASNKEWISMFMTALLIYKAQFYQQLVKNGMQIILNSA